MKKKYVSVLFVFLTISLFTGSSIASGITYPFTEPLIVKMSNDTSTNVAVKILHNNLLGSKVVEYGSFEYYLYLGKSLGVVIWVSHGNQNGFSLRGQLKDWSMLASLIRDTPNKDIVLMCYSNQLIKQTSLDESEALTFSGTIDARYGALLVAYLLTQDKNLLIKMTNVLIDLLSGGTYLPLYFSNVEKAWWIITLVVSLNLLLLDLYMDREWSFVQKAALKILTVGKIQIFTTMIYLAKGWITLSAAFSTIVSFVHDSLSYIWDAYTSASWWEKAAMIAAAGLAFFALIAEYLSSASTGGLVSYAKYAAVGATILALAAGIYGDYTDSDAIVG